jgi:TRAP transporter TAXI family solute receptor
VNSTGVPTTDIHGEFAPYDVAVDRLLNGDVDAAILTLMPPQEPVARAFRGGARLKEVDGPEVDGLRVHYPLLRRTLLPAGTYPGQDKALHTVGVDLMLVCRADLSNDIAYALTRALFEEVPRRIRQQLDPQRAPATVIPLHPGAARYYRERELSR